MTNKFGLLPALEHTHSLIFEAFDHNHGHFVCEHLNQRLFAQNVGMKDIFNALSHELRCEYVAKLENLMLIHLDLQSGCFDSRERELGCVGCNWFQRSLFQTE